ncbi:hypothetical protein [Bordetella bronchialis]|uniref:Uncharacterized protein n=1 Tax=Bordetella bronchialis TaxID=463025 RepID=A0ABM6CWI9_9BORD|nr:hypothetical protein [Bordetella bronchialis]ANN68515.1 hypothetical protein BAU06_21385 [Bordetella bronchialis]
MEVSPSFPAIALTHPDPGHLPPRDAVMPGFTAAEIESSVKSWAEKLGQDLTRETERQRVVLDRLRAQLEHCGQRDPRAQHRIETQFLANKLKQEREQLPAERLIWEKLANGGGITVHGPGSFSIESGTAFNNWKALTKKNSTHILQHSREFHRFVERQSGIPGYATRLAYAKELQRLRELC